MTTYIITFFSLLLAFCPLQAVSQSPGSQVLEAGVGVVDVTGKDAVILDPLKVKAIVFRQGTEQLALVECDVTYVYSEILDPARSKASEVTGIPYRNITISATHTHMDAAQGDLESAIVAAVQLAQTDLKVVRLSSGVGQEFNVAHNRRYFMKDGSVKFNPMFLNPNIVRSAGPIDADLGFVLLKDKGGKPVASLSNYSLHADIVKEYGAVYQNDGAGSPNAVSADYPYWLEEALRKDFGDDFHSIFFTGCCGNINHWDFSKPGPQSGHKTKSKQVGDALYSAINTILPELREEIPSLAVMSRVVQVPLHGFTDEDLEWATKVDDDQLSNKSEEPDERQQFLDQVMKTRILWLNKQKQLGNTSIPLDVQVFRLSDQTVIVTLPGEMFVEHGLTIKNFSPFENTLVVELSNNSEVAYVPTKLAYKQGGYEVVNSRLAPGGGELLVQTAIELLHDIKEVH